MTDDQTVGADVVIDIHAHMLVPAAADHVPVEQAAQLDDFIRFARERSTAAFRTIRSLAQLTGGSHAARCS